MYEDTKVSQLVINQLSEEKFKELLENDELDQNQLYMTDDRAGYTPPLLSTLWSDHTINDISWLCADTFSWQSGDVYVAAYNHLVTDFEGTTAETETISNIEITFYRAEDGHKICLPGQEDNIVALYELTGVAWYYILDTENQQFKLPRTQYGFTGLRDSVGGYVEAGLPNITGVVTGLGDVTVSGAFARGSYVTGNGGGSGRICADSFDASRSSSIYGNSDTVQPPATQMYLYFYVGNFERDAVEQTAGITTETLNGKTDVDLSNMNASQSAKDTIVGWSVPDYSAGIEISANTDFICPTNGVVAGEVSAASNGYCQIKVNGTNIMQVGSENNQRCRGPFYAQIQKGDVVHLLTSGNADIPQSNFFPLKGVN